MPTVVQLLALSPHNKKVAGSKNYFACALWQLGKGLAGKWMEGWRNQLTATNHRPLSCLWPEDFHWLHHGGDDLSRQSAGGLHAHVPQPRSAGRPEGLGSKIIRLCETINNSPLTSCNCLPACGDFHQSDSDARHSECFTQLLLVSPPGFPSQPSAGLPRGSNFQVNAGLHLWQWRQGSARPVSSSSREGEPPPSLPIESTKPEGSHLAS